MSRIGKKIIELPESVNVKLEGGIVRVKGPNGELSWACPAVLEVSLDDRKIQVKRGTDSKTDRSLHGLARSLIFNMVTGVSKGYERVLELSGVGYRAQVQGAKLMMTLGYSHPVEYQLPAGVSAAVDQKQTTITLKGADKQQLGQVAANLRGLRPPDIYKGKGVRYSGERLKLKAGKAGKK